MIRGTERTAEKTPVVSANGFWRSVDWIVLFRHFRLRRIKRRRLSQGGAFFPRRRIWREERANCDERKNGRAGKNPVSLVVRRPTLPSLSVLFTSRVAVLR